MSGDIVQRTVDAMVAETEQSPWNGIAAKTIFFGGGTPTFLSVSQLGSLLKAVTNVHAARSSDVEITSEANPGTVDAEKFEAMREMGFNRISLGAQSFFDDDLLKLGRIHQAGHIERAVEAARDAGFKNINIDLMFALPGQSLKAWEHNLDRATALGTDHLSLYGLTLEPNTPFYKENQKGRLELPDDDVQIAMYEMAVSKTAEAGFVQYEISNFAKPGFECQHNLCYWHNETYAGYGPGAVGFMDGRRYTNWKHPERYCAAVESREPIHFEEEFISEDAERLEKIMLGLRLNEGLPLDALKVDRDVMSDLQRKGWVESSEDVLRLTPSGRHFCSEVVLALA